MTDTLSLFRLAERSEEDYGENGPDAVFPCRECGRDSAYCGLCFDCYCVARENKPSDDDRFDAEAYLAGREEAGI